MFLRFESESIEWNISEMLTTIHELLTATLFRLQATPVTVMSILIFFFFLIGSIFLGRFVKNMLQFRILPQFGIDEGLRFTFGRVSYYIIVGIGVIVSFQFVGIDLSSLAVIFGLLSVGIGFGLQNVTSNFISGLIVLFERPIAIGDRVKVAGVEGDVIEINIRSTKIRTLNNISIIVPNQEFVGSQVINFSHGDPTYRLDLEVGVSYASDLDLVLKALQEVGEEHPEVMKTPPVQVHLKNFGDSSWDMQLRVWIPDVKRYPLIRNELNQSVVRKFAEYGIEIPFPQRDLHVRSSIDFPIKSEPGKA